MKHDFGWGDTRGIREIMLSLAPFLNIKTFDYNDFGYPPHPGRPELVEELRTFIQSLTGHRYDYVLVTNGALNAVSTYVNAAKSNQTVAVHTNELYFGRYPGLIKNAGLEHETEARLFVPPATDILLIDSPSNPEGELTNRGRLTNCVWDAAYYSPAYCGLRHQGKLRNHHLKPVHEAMAGSLNKLTGINGLRIGWLATDNSVIYHKALEHATSDLCGLSQLSQISAYEILTKVDMDLFYERTKNMLDNNKTEMEKLNYLFGHQAIPTHGMFVIFEVDKGIRDLLDKAGVQTMDGAACGDVRNSVRFNLGNSNRSTALMVKDVLAADGK